MEQLLPEFSEDSQSGNSSNTTSNSTQVYSPWLNVQHCVNQLNIQVEQQRRCNGSVNNFVDEYRDLTELYIGLTFIVRDLVDIEHDLDPHYPHQSQNN